MEQNNLIEKKTYSSQGKQLLNNKLLRTVFAGIFLCTVSALAGNNDNYKSKVLLGISSKSCKLPKKFGKNAYGQKLTYIKIGSSFDGIPIKVEDVLIGVNNKRWKKAKINIRKVLGEYGDAVRPGNTAEIEYLESNSKLPIEKWPVKIAKVVYKHYINPQSNALMRKDLVDYVAPGEKLCLQIVEKCGGMADYKDLINRHINSEMNPDRFRLPIVRYLRRDPFKLNAVAYELTSLLDKQVTTDKLLSTTEYVLTKFNSGKPHLRAGKQDFKERDLNSHISYIENILKKCAELNKEAFANLSEEECKFIIKHREAFLSSYIKFRMICYDNNSERLKNTIKLLNLLDRVNVEKLIEQARLASCLTSPEFTASLKNVLLKDKNINNKIILKKKTPYGLIIIGGKGPNAYRTNCAVIYDLGGDDIYHNNQAASIYKSVPTSLIYDYAGDDSYEATDSFSQGCGDFGVGILIDAAGDDNYIGRFYNQGTGFAGIGILNDFEGNDTYRGIKFEQGVGLVGAGILVDKSGNDTYNALDSSQAVGYSKGFGLLYDIDGNDKYYCKGLEKSSYNTRGVFKGWGQGVGIGFRFYYSGGVGLLLDGNGSDRYEGGNFTQGGGYYYGFGMLHDRGDKDDNYIGSRYAQGFAAHEAVGIFLEDGGNDRYQTRYSVAQGLSWDLTSVLFVDYSGNDRYEGTGFSLGASAHNGICLFFDLQGKDAYREQNPARAGRNNYHGGKSLSFFVDAGGAEDKYGKRKNNSARTRKENSIFLDLPGSIEQAAKDKVWQKLMETTTDFK